MEEIIQVKNQELTTKTTEIKSNLQKISLLNKTIKEQQDKINRINSENINLKEINVQMKNKLIDKSEIFDINNSYVDSQRIIEDKEKKIFDMEIESKENKQKLMNLLNKANSEIKKQKKECENKISFVEKMNNINNKK